MLNENFNKLLKCRLRCSTILNDFHHIVYKYILMSYEHLFDIGTHFLNPRAI